MLAAGRDAGLDRVGVAGAQPFLDARRALVERRAEGLHGGMEFTYRNPDRSTDPSATFDGARSLVVAALRYPSDQPDPLPSGRPEGRVARYATADHYGRLRAGLTAMAEQLRSAGFRALVLADDNALVDRAAAHRAGLGWFGKNANLLLPGRGSWFVLGSVVTDAALEPAPEPVQDGCGSCRRCLDGCPTGAIVAPGVVDAGRCLSWHLQMEGDFPREFRVALGDRLYGCDECQEVCPPNRRADHLGQGAPADPSARTLDRVDILWVLAASDQDLLDRLGRWYIPRRDPRYLRRNALVVLGNTGADHRGTVTAEVQGALRTHLAGPDDLLAGHATWAARRLGCDHLLDEVGVSGRSAVRAEVSAADRAGDDGGPWPVNA